MIPTSTLATTPPERRYPSSSRSATFSSSRATRSSAPWRKARWPTHPTSIRLRVRSTETFPPTSANTPTPGSGTPAHAAASATRSTFADSSTPPPFSVQYELRLPAVSMPPRRKWCAMCASVHCSGSVPAYPFSIGSRCTCFACSIRSRAKFLPCLSITGTARPPGGWSEAATLERIIPIRLHANGHVVGIDGEYRRERGRASACSARHRAAGAPHGRGSSRGGARHRSTLVSAARRAYG